MFSSTNITTPSTIISLNNMSPFPQYYFPSSSSSSPPNYLLQPQSQLPLSSSLLHQEHDLFLPQNHHHQYHDPPFSLPNNSPQITLPETLINLGVSNYNTTGIDSATMAAMAGPAAPIPPKKKLASAATKKDRHSKIYTAQGLRDRRVRLSIEIAREFFDLHDTLGFDKASKTLEWLLSKSRKAIRELSRTTTINEPRGSKSLLSNCTNVSECGSEVAKLGHCVAIENVNFELEEAEADERLALSKSNAAAKESRAKARARARARTKEKISYNCDVSHSKKIVEKCGSGSQISTQFRTLMNSHHHQPIFFAEANGINCQQATCPLRLACELDGRDNVVIKRKCLKFPLTSSTGYGGDRDRQQEFFEISKVESSNNNNNNNAIYSSSSSSSLLLPANWEINCTAPSPRPS